MPKKKEEEPDRDSWSRFERAVDAAVKSGPKHMQPKTKAPPARKTATTKAPKPEKK